MTLDARAALRDGADDLASARGALFYVLFTAFALASLPVHQTLTREMSEWFVSLVDVPQDQVVVPVAPLALDVGLPVVVGALAVIFVVAELLRLVAIRSFASDATAVVPMDEVTERAGRTVLVLLAASILVQVLVYGGFALFVIPGIIAAVLTLFVRQAVLLDGDGVVHSLRRSVSIVMEYTAQSLLILLVLLALSFVVGIPTVFLDPETAAQPIAGAILGTVVTVYGVAVLTRAYQQARAAEEANDALGPDDIDGDDGDADAYTA